MNARGASVAGLTIGLGLTAASVAAVMAVMVFIRRADQANEATRRAEAENIGIAILSPPTQPITDEAEVFRTRPEALAIADYSAARRPANPRTLHSYRTRRAYPGAPPQIPHGLTGKEFRAGNCTTCHERGGYSPRFGAYVPVTPHPEMGPCLQCHVGVDAITGVTLPSSDPNTICRQCHDADAPRANPPAVWSTTVWPRLWTKSPGAPPPPIPHDLAIRANCLACHAGPAAVPEIRTSHPERANCRQCHVAIDAAAERFTRPTVAAGSDTEGPR